LFFHPAVWLVSRWVRQEREHCCDELVLGRLGDRQSYAETLLAVVRRGVGARRLELALAAVAGGPASAMGRRDVRSRIDRILRWEDETMQVSRRLGIVVPVALLAAVAIGTTFGLSQGRAGPREEPAPVIPAEAESDDPSQQDGSQQAAVRTPDRDISRADHIYLNAVEVPDDYFYDFYLYLEAMKAYPRSRTPRSRSTIVLPYELDDDCLVNQNGTISSLFFASAFSEPETSTEPPPEEEQPKPGSQGEVRWVNQPKMVVWINLGREDGLEKGTQFRVYGRAKEDGSLGDEKGTIVVTRILGDHLSEARIEQDRPGDPIIPGDRIHWPQRKGQAGAIATGKDVASSEPADLTGALRKQVEALRKELRRLQQERDQLVNERVQLTDELHNLRVERQKLQEEMKDAQQGPVEGREAEVETVDLDNDGHPDIHVIQWTGDSDIDLLAVDKGDGTFTHVWLVAVQGVVLGVSEKGLVEISIGSDDGLSRGQRLEVYRHQTSTSAYVGRIEVIETRPDRAVCRILAEFLQRPVQKGDRVATKLPLGGGAAAPRPPRQPDARSPGTSPGRVNTDAPEPTSETPKTDADMLNIDAEGLITLNGVKITLDVLHEALQALRQEPERKSGVLVVAHPDANHQRVVEVLDACAQAGISKVRLATATDENKTRPQPIPRAEPKPADD
jgi:biopolymer transport protein ExbD